VSALQRTAVLDVVGLTRALMGPDTPCLSALARQGAITAIRPVQPAVTCSAQSTYLTGVTPAGHGIVGNGWYDRELAQVVFWRQANQLVSGEKVWETARRSDPACTVAKMFWWFNMYSSADWSVTPRPIYPADGRKIPDIYSAPADLRSRLVSALGPFPFFSFWGPASDLKSSQWIADASRLVAEWHSPTLLLVYLPHLDYNLQRLGVRDPVIREDVRAIDAVCGALVTDLQAKSYHVIVLSEYGLTDVTGPVHINRALRAAGLLAVRPELGLEALDPGASDAFAVADHQVAHVYVRDPAKRVSVQRVLESVPGVAAVLDGPAIAAAGLAHPRSGDLLALAARDRWFTYYYWNDDRVAPDFARTVDIHRKPGYDPAELFVDPAIRWPKARVAWTLAKKAAGFRTLMRMIPLDGSLVRGSHGLAPRSRDESPVLISSRRTDWPDELPATAVRDVILAHLTTSPHWRG
jgi:predicted AlkP superfamily pyrophosphatase or phosphodiesterase